MRGIALLLGWAWTVFIVAAVIYGFATQGLVAAFLTAMVTAGFGIPGILLIWWGRGPKTEESEGSN